MEIFDKDALTAEEQVGFPRSWEHFSVTRLKKHESKNTPNLVR